jgi:hypothetical protein
MVIISKETHVKAKKGQVLIITLVIMAIGLIVIGPLLSYTDSSYTQYTQQLKITNAYYSADAMMGVIFADMYAGKDIYMLNQADSTRYNNQSWLNGCKINTSITDTIASVPPPDQPADWVYLDPGCAFGLNCPALNALSSGTTHSFELYLTEGTTVMAHWYFKDSSNPGCAYYCIGRMLITCVNGTTVADTGSVSNGTSVAFNKSLTYTVPLGGNNLYYINFSQTSVQGQRGSCANTSRSTANMAVKPAFSADGDFNNTWVRTGNSSGGQVYQYQDYTITSTASIGNTYATIQACVRQSPGPLMWWEPQSLVVISWTIS